MRKLSNENWRALFETLLKNPGEVGYHVDVTADEILINADRENAEQISVELEKTLQTSDNFFAEMPYSIRNNNAVKTGSATPGPTPLLEDSVVEGIDVLKRLYGQEVFDNIALNIEALFNEERGAESVNHVLYSKPARGAKTAELWHDFLEALLVSFSKVDVVKLREIWTNSNQFLPYNDESHELSEKQIYQGLIQQCFGIKKNSDHTAVQLYFNYGKLHHLIFPPIIDIQENPELSNQVSLHINKQHLLEYMQQLTQDGILLRVIKEPEHAGYLARPITFGDIKVNAKSNYCNLIVDQSYSMNDSLKKLGDDIITFIDKLKEHDETTKIRITYFSDTTGPIEEFNVAESEKIRKFIKNKVANGGTRLFGTIEDELIKLHEENRANHFNAAVVVFTDGHDNESGDKGLVTRQIIEKMKMFDGKIKLFTFGIGDAYDHDALNNFSQQAGSPFIHLKSVGNFNEIYEYLDTIQYEEKLREFIVKAQNAQHYTVPVTLNGNIQTPRVFIPFKEGEQVLITTDSEELVVNIKDSSIIPSATENDQLDILETKILKIVANEDDSPSFKHQELMRLQDKISNLKIPLITDVKQKHESLVSLLDQYLDDLKSKPSEALHLSLQSRARHALGYKSKKIRDVTDDAANEDDSTTGSAWGRGGFRTRDILSIPEDGDDISASNRLQPSFLNPFSLMSSSLLASFNFIPQSLIAGHSEDEGISHIVNCCNQTGSQSTPSQYSQEFQNGESSGFHLMLAGFIALVSLSLMLHKYFSVSHNKATTASNPSRITTPLHRLTIQELSDGHEPHDFNVNSAITSRNK